MTFKSFTAACVFVVVSTVALAQTPPAKPVAEPAKSGGGLQSRVFIIEHVTPTEFLGALTPLLSVGPSRVIVPNNATKTISVRDLPENLAAIEAVIKLLDKPPSKPDRGPGPVDVSISVIAASMNERAERSAEPPALAPVLEQLKRTLSFKHYRYVTTLTHRVQVMSSAKAAGTLASPFPTGTPGDRPAAYQYELRGVTGTQPESGPATFSMAFSFKLVVGRVTNLPQVQVGVQTPLFEEQVLSLETSALSVQEGEHVVVGSSGAGNGDQSVIVVVSARQAGK